MLLNRNRKRWIMAGCALWLAAGADRGARAAAVPAFQSRDFSRAAAMVPSGSHLRLEGVQVADGEPVAFALERFEVFADDARITIHRAEGDELLPAPANAYFRGTIEGRPESRVFLARLENGAVQGIVNDGGDAYLIGADDAPAKALNAPLEMQRVDPALLKSGRGGAFTCSEDQLPKGPGNNLSRSLAPAGGIAEVEEASGQLPVKAATRTARVAIESDFEFYSLFNNTTNATNYIGNLLGFVSLTYVAELSTSLVVQSVSLWTTNVDPWTQNSTTCGLMEFGYYWNKNKTGVSRTIAHFLSGKGLGGGIAWLGVLCSGPFNVTTTCPGLATDTSWGGGYGFTASITGGFNVNNPTVMWDSMAVAHEIGHNFDSPHSHCYAGIGGNANPIDQCYSGESGCYSGATSLPGPAGLGSGTLMSYCHLVRGSYSDISMTFGTGFIYGVQPGREAAMMNSYVNGVVAGNPSCMALVSSGLLADGFEGGLLPGPWSGKVP